MKKIALVFSCVVATLILSNCEQGGVGDYLNDPVYSEYLSLSSDFVGLDNVSEADSCNQRSFQARGYLHKEWHE